MKGKTPSLWQIHLHSMKREIATTVEKKEALLQAISLHIVPILENNVKKAQAVDEVLDVEGEAAEG
eukprot:3481307-Ditylum_brightwellii.AAC.1